MCCAWTLRREKRPATARTLPWPAKRTTDLWPITVDSRLTQAAAIGGCADRRSRLRLNIGRLKGRGDCYLEGLVRQNKKSKPDSPFSILRFLTFLYCPMQCDRKQDFAASVNSLQTAGLRWQHPNESPHSPWPRPRRISSCRRRRRRHRA